jgi:glycosyltransferase involved in cell wall biosynthesis
MISIIIPTFNEEKYLPRLLSSIRAQTYRKYEIIVVDGNSKDATQNIARKYGCRLYTEPKNKKGHPGKARNIGAKHARGDMLMFLDSDVVIPPTFLAELIEKAERRKIGVASGYLYPDNNNILDKIMTFFVDVYCYVLQGISPHGGGMYIFARKAVHRKIGGFNRELFLGEDHDYLIRASKVAKFAFLFSPKIKISMRRLEKEGRLGLIFKYAYVELYRLFKGDVKKKIVKYEFGKF